jgi:HlyD family secretion protein
VDVAARNTTMAWIRQGLAPGQAVVLYPPAALADGRKVRVRAP